jgi:hypothetical protein
MEFCCIYGYNHDLIILCVVMPYIIASLDYSISGSVVSVSGYPCSEHMDEDYVLMVFEALDDGARLA